MDMQDCMAANLIVLAKSEHCHEELVPPINDFSQNYFFLFFYQHFSFTRGGAYLKTPFLIRQFTIDNEASWHSHARQSPRQLRNQHDSMTG